MAKDAEAAEREAAETRYAEAQAALAEAAQAAAEAGQGLAATVTRGVPDMVVEVKPGNHVSHGGKAYYGEGYVHAPDGHKGNDRFSVDGPTAIALMQSGHVQVKGEA